MARRVPTTTIDVIGKLNLDPELAIGNYIESKQGIAFIIKPPVWDTAGDTVELFFINTKREHDSMLALQKESLETSKRDAITNELRTHRLYKIQGKLRKRMYEANIFMKECEEKRHSAEKEVIAEKRLHENLRKKIEKFKNYLTTLTQFRFALKNTYDEYESYEEVIHEVINRSDIFESPKDCVDRCDALMLTQVAITEMNTAKLLEIQNMFERIKKITNAAALKVMGLKNEIAELERSFNKASNRCFYWERIFAKAKDAIVANECEKESMYEGVRVMYKILCRRKMVEPYFQRVDIEKQLDFIKSEMEMLQSVIMKCEYVDTKDVNKESPYSRCY